MKGRNYEAIIMEEYLRSIGIEITMCIIMRMKLFIKKIENSKRRGWLWKQ